MPDDACPISQPADRSEAESIRQILTSKRIAVVGATDDPTRPSHYVPAYLQQQGYEIIPVNPTISEALGVPAVASLRDIEGPVDAVNIFRRSTACADIVRDAIAIGAKGVWLQSGISNEEAKSLAKDANIAYVENRCIMVEHSRRR